VKPREGALHDPAFFAEARPVLGVAPGDHGLHATRPQLTAVLVVVIAAVGEEPLSALARTSRLTGDGTYSVDQRQQLGDVVAIAASQADRERNPIGVGDQMVL
jgi:hypothetical protein